MGQVSLSVSIQRSADRWRSWFEGMVMAEAEAVMTEALEHAASKGARSVVLDFSSVSGIDSGGASTLVKLWALAKSRRMIFPLPGWMLGSKRS